MKKQTYNKDIESFAVYMYGKARNHNPEAKSFRPRSKAQIIELYHTDPLFKKAVDTQFVIKTKKDYERRLQSFMKMVSENDYQEIQTKRCKTLGKEGLHEVRKKGVDTLGGKGSKKLSEIAKRAHEKLSPEEKSLRSKKGRQTLGPEGCSLASKKRAETLGFERLSEISKKGRKKVSYESKMAFAKGGQTTGAQSKRKKSDLLYAEVLKQLPNIFTSTQAKELIVKMGYKEARWLQMKRNCQFIELIPMIGKPNQYNPEKYYNRFGEN